MPEWFGYDLNEVGALASIAGVVLGFPALVIALVQLWRTKKAAEAAAASSKETLERVSTVVAVASVEQICSRVRDLVHLIRARDHIGSATAAFELRDAVARFSKSKVALQLQQENAWMELLAAIAEIHDELERASASRKIDPERRKVVLQAVTRVHTQLSMMSAVAGEKAGEINANW